VRFPGEAGLLAALLALRLAATAQAEEPPAKKLQRAVARWESACPVKPLLGLCLRPVEPAKKAAQQRCEARGARSTTAVRRDPEKADQARTLFEEVWATAHGSRVAATRAAAARARLLTGDSLLELFLAEVFPAGLDFSSPRSPAYETSRTQLTRYLEKKGRTLMAARMVYQEVAALAAAPWSLAAQARLGQLHQLFADELSTALVPQAPVPRTMTGKEREEFLRSFAETYCKTLHDYAGPLEKKAQEAFRECAAAAKKLGASNEWSKLCSLALEAPK
jgi:hypothetical protein